MVEGYSNPVSLFMKLQREENMRIGDSDLSREQDGLSDQLGQQIFIGIQKNGLGNLVSSMSFGLPVI